MKELQVIEDSNPTAIRIFMTQAEINYFHSANDDKASTSRRHRVLTEPVNEPFFEAQTKKNTFYQPKAAHNSYLNDSNFANDAFEMSFQGSPVSVPIPVIDPALQY